MPRKVKLKVKAAEAQAAEAQAAEAPAAQAAVWFVSSRARL